MRVFVALDLPDTLRSKIGALVEHLRPACRNARWIRLGGAHITLKFIGEVSNEKVSDIKSALASVRREAPIEINFRGMGFFPNDRSPRVLWLGVDAAAGLAGLAQAIESALEPRGIPPERRAFSPHLTLARFKPGAGIESLPQTIAAAGPIEFGSSGAREFHLYRSILKPGGAEYTRLETFRIAGSEVR